MAGEGGKGGAMCCLLPKLYKINHEHVFQIWRIGFVLLTHAGRCVLHRQLQVHEPLRVLERVLEPVTSATADGQRSSDKGSRSYRCIV